MSRVVVLGDLNLDVHAVAFDAVAPGSEVRSTVWAAPGGSAGTFARVAAAEGAAVTFLGCVGTDLIGDLLVQSLEDSGIEAVVGRAEGPSGTILALEQGSERTMICSRGANDGLTETSIEEGVFSGVDHLHVSGYAVLSAHQLPAAHRAIAFARQHGATVSIDPPPASLIASFGVEAFLDEISCADWVFPNLAEGKLLAGHEEPEAIADALSTSFSVGSVTLGPRGALAWSGEERDLAAIAEPVSGDTTGAGDAYAAAFVVARLRGETISIANARACTVATDRIARQRPERLETGPEQRYGKSPRSPGCGGERWTTAPVC